MENGVKYIQRTYSTRNTQMLEKARVLAYYDFRGEMFVNPRKGTITCLTSDAEKALPELTGIMS